MCRPVAQRAGEDEGSGDHEREPEAAGAGLQDALQSEYTDTHHDVLSVTRC